MAARGHVPSAFDGRSIQAPGMMRHGPPPTHGSASHCPLEPLPPPDLLENKVAVQGAEMDRLIRENQRLAATHGSLRQELLIAQQEMQRVRAHVGRVQTESDIQIRGLLEKISKTEVEIKTGETIKKELQQAHLEAQNLIGARQELGAEIQQVTEELQRTHSELRKLPELHGDLEGLMQEHQKLRATFEHEKGSNMELVQKLHAMEKNLVTMAREVEKLRVEVQNAEKKVQVPHPYQNAYANADSAYQNMGQIAYADGVYGHGLAYSNGGYGQVGSYASGSFSQGVAGNYADPYGRTQLQMGGASVGEGTDTYGGGGSSVISYDGSGAIGNASGTYNNALQAGVGAPIGSSGTYSIQAGASATVAYDATKLNSSSAVTYDAARAGTVAVGTYDPTKGTAVAVYDAARAPAVSNSGLYDPARAGMTAASAHDASRGTAVGTYDATRGSVANSAVLYDPARAGMNAPGVYDVARGAQPSVQR